MTGTRFVRCSLLGFLISTTLMAGQGRAQGNQPRKPAAHGLTAEEARTQMVDEEIVAAGVKNARVIAAMRATPRHEFVPRPLWPKAYYDMALPIGEGQTISPPFIVAYMTEAIDPQPKDKVLEIGTGSGYQAAVLSGLVQEVYSIEIVKSLGERAAKTLKAAQVRERTHQDRRRLPRLARACPVRQDHRHLLPGKSAAAAGRPTQGRRADRDPRRRALSADIVSAQEDRRQDAS